jgi:predicted 3-demethylubiquinone-9 3-methyltransferase (glyoxalase superfamily)
MQKITPFLWFNDNAEEAVALYTSTFKNSRTGAVARYGEEAAKASGRPAGSVMTIEFELNGEPFTALNGGPVFKFSQAISFVANCDSQQEIDQVWEKLSAGGEIQQCGWLLDKFGVAWQVIPVSLPKLMTGPKANNVMKELLEMKKVDLRKLEEAGR